MGQGFSAKLPERIEREQERNTRTANGQETAQQESLQSIEDILARAIPSHPIMCGIYFLIRGGKIVYIGQSLHVEARLSNHALLKKFDSWTWVPCDREALSTTERAYINTLMPEENRDMVTDRIRNPPVWLEAELARKQEDKRLAQIDAEEEAEYQKTMERMKAVARSLG